MSAKHHIAGFDSLRLFAIILIVIYHCFPDFLPGGFVAVEIFFVLSGFLIGSKLIRESKEKDMPKGLKGFFKFFLSRLGRLLPALLLCMIITLSIAYFLNPDVLTSARENSLYAVTFSTNIMSIINGTSYETALTPNLFNHTWFLALEFQVCLLAYIVFKIFFYFRNNKKEKNYIGLGVICLAISIISFIIMAIYGGRYELFDRAYFGIDSHIGAFFIGAALSAFVASKKDLFAPAKTRRYMWMVFLALELLLIISISPFLKYSSIQTFIAALPITTIVSYLMIISVLKLQSDKHSKIIGLFEYLGSISFYLYLFHWPFYILAKNILQSSDILYLAPYIAIFASLIISILADKIIMPFFLKKQRVINYIIIALSLVLPILSLIKAPDVSSIAENIEQGKEESTAQNNDEENAIDYTGIVELGSTFSEQVLPYFNETASFAKIYYYVPAAVTYRGGGFMTQYYRGGTNDLTCRTTPDTSPASLAALKSVSVMAVGDSVMLGAQTQLSGLGYFVDAVGSRNMYDVIELLSKYKQATGGILPRTIVVGAITNWSNVTTATLSTLVNTVGAGHNFVFVTGFCGHCGFSSRDPQNNAIRAFANGGNIKVADWAALAISNLGAYTYADQTHLTPAGRAAFANLVEATIGGY